MTDPKTDTFAIDEQLDRKLNLYLRTACLLMECSADTTRIMRNLRRTAGFLGLDADKLQTFVDYEMLMVSYDDGYHTPTRFRRCKHHSIDFAAITRISHLSWEAIRYDYSLDEYDRRLTHIGSAKRHYTPWQVAVGSGFACGGFCIQFGCDWPAFFYASFAAIIGMRLKAWLGAKGANAYMGICIAALVSTVLAWLESFLSLSPTMVAALPTWMHSDTPWHPLMACALFIVPGVPIINFVSDMLDGYVRTGLVRAINTLLMIVAMSFGIVLAIGVCGIDNFVTDLTMVPHHSYVEFAVAAAISAMGFSMIFNTSPKLLPIVALGGIIAVCNRNFVNLGPSTGNFGLDQGIIVGSLAGSVLASLLAVMAAPWVHTPHQCLSIPSVIPMIPGVFMYRALFAFIELHGVVGEVTVAMHNLIMASLITMCIAIGVAIPNIFVRRMLESQRKLRLHRLLIARRRHDDGSATVGRER